MKSLPSIWSPTVIVNFSSQNFGDEMFNAHVNKYLKNKKMLIFRLEKSKKKLALNFKMING
jgi:hypothetical protein